MNWNFLPPVFFERVEQALDDAHAYILGAVDEVFVVVDDALETLKNGGSETEAKAETPVDNGARPNLRTMANDIASRDESIIPNYTSTWRSITDEQLVTLKESVENLWDNLPVQHKTWVPRSRG